MCRKKKSITLKMNINSCISIGQIMAMGYGYGEMRLHRSKAFIQISEMRDIPNNHCSLLFFLKNDVGKGLQVNWSYSREDKLLIY